MAPVFGYWDLRGLAEPIRFLLHHVGEDFEDKRYEIKSPKEHDMNRSEWLQEKFTLGLPFPNLPYYIDGDVKLTQSIAILRYLAGKYNLDGSTEGERQVIDVVEQLSRDLLQFLAIVAYGDFDNKKEEYLKSLPEKLKVLEDFLGEKKWVVGDRVTYVDFMLYEGVDHNRLLDSTCLDQFPTIKTYMDRFEALPNIKKYMESGQYKAWPLYSPIAKWGFYK